jgi:hypothetical protein
MKNILALFLILALGSCWAPRCPMDRCRVRMEHVHGDQVSGIFSGRKLHKPVMHYPWDKNKGEKNPDTSFQPDGPSRKQKKARKKFPWEKW